MRLRRGLSFSIFILDAYIPAGKVDGHSFYLASLNCFIFLSPTARFRLIEFWILFQTGESEEEQMNLTVVPPIEIKLVVADAVSMMTIVNAKKLSKAKGLKRRENGIVITRECNDSLTIAFLKF